MEKHDRQEWVVLVLSDLKEQNRPQANFRNYQEVMAAILQLAAIPSFELRTRI
jgi:hypothetical protein